jgi:hypothetical protein
MATWNTAYEALPPGTTETGGLGDDRIRSWKAEIGDRFDQEHVWMSTSSSGQTVHRKGSARAYYQAAAPTLRPDAATALGTLDNGRLFVGSDTNDLYIWTGSAFAGVGGYAYVDQGGGDRLLRKVVDIGTWQLSIDSDVAFNHGLTLSTIRRIEVIVQTDDGTKLDSIQGHGTFLIYATAADLFLASIGSYFNGDSNYSGTGNRGYVVIWYTEA